MPFRTRNPYYLRISERNVLPLYLYLDERHVNWMTDTLLQRVLADLQPKILPKLRAEADSLNASSASNKKATVDTHRGDSYEFCYFIRKTDPHSVLIKTRQFSLAPARKQSHVLSPLPSSQSKNAKRKASMDKTSSKRRKTKGKGKAKDIDEVEAVSSDIEEESISEVPETLRRSQRSKKIATGDYRDNNRIEGDSDVDMDDLETLDDSRIPIKMEGSVSEPPSTLAGTAATPISLDLDEEEEKPKPVLSVKFQDFAIYGHCLCIVVQPYPPFRAMSASSRASSLAPIFSAPNTSGLAQARTAAAIRARTPLFLPDDDRSTPAPFPIPALDDTGSSDLDEDEDVDMEVDDGGMLAFSQTMNTYNHVRVGAAADDDDDIDGAVFFGDADEVREL